jgi:RND superfamily putative drug exporter
MMAELSSWCSTGPAGVGSSVTVRAQPVARTRAPSAMGPATAAPSVLSRLARAVLRHRRRVMLVWLVAFLAGGVAASHLAPRLSYDFSLPGQPSYETSQRILHVFGNGGPTAPSIAVVTPAHGGLVEAQRPKLSAALTAIARTQPEARLVDWVNTGDTAFITNRGRSTFVYVFVAPSRSLGTGTVAPAVTAELARQLPGDHVGVTGINQLSNGGSSKGPGVLVETVFGGLGALLVLAFVFASFLALVPLLIAIVAIPTTLLVILGLTYVTPVSFVVQFLVALVGLGVAIDYSLLLVTRWREERSLGRPNDEAVVHAMETAGRSVALSGVTVAIGLLSLVVLPVPFLRSIGIGGMLIPLISVAVVLTLLPALLGGVGPRWDWPKVRNEASVSRGWQSWAGGLARRPWLGAIAAVVLLAVAISPVVHLRVGQTSAAAEASTGSAHNLYRHLLTGGAPAGIITPMEVVTSQQSAHSVATDLSSVRGVAAAAVPAGSAGSRDGISDLIVIPSVETVNSATLGPVRAVEQRLSGRPGVIGESGTGPGQQAFTNAVYGNVPLLVLVLAVLTFLLLARAFRSVVLALKAVVLNIVSLGAVFGILTWFWQEGHGSRAIFGIPPTGAVTFWVPITIFAFLYGLSMDYEVFILSRMREEYDATRSTEEAVVRGLSRTGRLVTSAALILFLAFASLASAPVTDIKVLATGLGIGILLDATVVRALLVPSLVVLFGKWNWWLPDRLARLLLLGSEAVVATPHGHPGDDGLLV